MSDLTKRCNECGLYLRRTFTSEEVCECAQPTLSEPAEQRSSPRRRRNVLNKDDIEKLHGVMLPDSENWKEQSLISSTPAGKGETPRTDAFHNRALNGDEDCAPLIDVRTGGIDYRTAYELALEEMEVMERELAQMAAQKAELQESLDRLTGMKFSSRMHAALVSRAETAERRVAELEAKLAEAGRDAERWKRMYECAQNANSFRQDAIDGL